jgi:tetratricopeptide (TPR) repeat protein
MTDQFRFSIQGLPKGEALTGSEVEERLLEKLRADDTCIDTIWSLARFYSQTGNQDAAAGCMHRIVELTDDPETRGACHMALGQLAEQTGDFSEAVSRYRDAVAFEPCSTQTWYFIHNNLGYSLNQIGQHEEAVPILQAAIEIDPDRPNGYKNLALSFQALGQLEEAAEMFIAATQADASDERSLRHLEELLEEHPSLLPDFQDRLELCRQVVEMAWSEQPDFDAHWEKLRRRQDGQRD